MASEPQSRVAAGRSRALTAKTLLAAGAVGAFGLFALVARAAHSGHHQTGTSGSGSLQTPSSLLDDYQSSSQGLESGQIAPSTAEPQVGTSTS